MDSDEESNSCGEDYISGDDQDPTEKCCFANEIFEIPESFCDQEEVFNEVLSFTTWETELSDKQKERLKMLLPTFPGDENEEEKDITLRKLFNRENFKFGNPLTQFFERLKDGFFSPEVVEANKALKKASYREYKNRQTRYHYRLFQQILLSRKKLLESAYVLPPEQPVKMQQCTAKPRDATLSERTRLRYFSILQDVREECCEPETSSEDENYPESSPPKVTRKHKKQLQILEASLSPEITRVTSTTAFPPGYPGSSHFLNRCLDMIEVSEERYREMLQTYKQKKLTDPTHPELDVSKVDLNDMIARANLSKRPLLKLDNHTKKKPKLLENTDKTHKVVPAEGDKLACDIKPSNIVTGRLSHTEELSFITNGEKCPEGNVQLIIENEFKNEAKPDKIELEAEPPHENMASPTGPEYYQYPMCFFSLLRDLFCESAELKISASKLEEKVRNWQEGPTASFHEWIHLHESWSDLVSSALRFLAGDLLSILPENFVPFLDYKEKQQQWQWIGSGRDSEELLVPLCQHWLENKDDVSLDVLESSQGSPPPPRTPTVWTVRATTDEEKILYREQERVRYQNPHKAFTFKVHGYESVVGPVKGVYGKESGVNKAREHSLLISDRPPFVTILSLVRDAAARLPNGEGTRADICELLKDSQYLSLASDQQIHTVVSGALDRLHYEKDPCVKYDVNRKLWIYLHRSRTEEEFERIHQAQAAAAKARKAVQKSKPPKPKNKDIPRTPPSATASSSSDPAGTFLNVDVTTISPNSSHSPRGSGSPRTQGSPKHSHPTANRHLIRTLSMPVSANVKTSVSVIHDNTNNSRKSELTQANLASSSSSSSSLPMGHSVVSMNSTVCSPQGSIGNNVLTSFHSEGNNSRPPSQGSVQSLPSPKTVIANVNAAQFVSVGSLQVGPTNSEQPVSSSVPPCIGVLSVDMKPSSPSFVGQPPVLQPVLSHQTMVTTSSLTCVSTAMASSLASSSSGNVPKSKLISSHNACGSKSIPSFQTIVIKPDASLRSGGNISSLPLLSMEELSATDSTVLNSNPVVARLLHGSQLLSLGNIMAGAASGNLLKQGQTGIQNFKIQGTNFGQQVLPTTNVNLFQSGHSSVNASSDVKLPRLSLVNHETGCHDSPLISSTSAINQSTVYSINQGMTHLPAETKVSSSHREVSDTKRLTISSHNLAGMRPTMADLGHLLDSAGAPNHVITSSSTPSCNISNASVGKSAASVVIGTQETLKPMASTYVMTSPITNASMLTSQHGLRAATSLNMRALHSIKVIPVPQSMGPNKNIRSTPLLARIISPSTGMTLRSAVPSELVHAAHHLKGTTAMNIVHGLQSVANQSHILKAAASHTCTNSDVSNNQPFIIQVQAPKTSNEDLNL